MNYKPLKIKKMKDIREIVKGLTDDELIQINEEFDKDFIGEDALLRRITEESSVGGQSTVTQMLGVIGHSSIELAKRLKVANKLINTKNEV